MASEHTMLKMNWQAEKYIPIRDMWWWSVEDPRVWWCYSYVDKQQVSILKVGAALSEDALGRDAPPLVVVPGHVDPEVHKHDIMFALLGRDIMVVAPGIKYEPPLRLTDLAIGGS